jgi:bacillithiol biosynthesis cysteine-adding enzyme BshC
MTDEPGRVYDFGAFFDPPSVIFRDYLSGRPGARAFFQGGAWDLDAIAHAAERTLELPRDREALVRALVRQQQRRGAQRAAAQAERLLDPRAVAVVSGQQAGLFGGPLYVLYKALGARRVARELEARRAQPVVPVFWVASDDHDFAEVRATTVIDDAGHLRTLRYAPHAEPQGQPAARILLDDTLARLLDELEARLPDGPHKDAAVRRVRAAYAPGVSLAAAFAALLGALLPDVVLLDPADAELKALMRPVLRREIEERSPSSRLAAECGAALLAAGYHQQVPVRPGFLNLFVLMDGERRALAHDDDTLELRGLGRRLPRAEALARLDTDPADWSPSALLRPLAQDFLLPTAAYVGGPAEIAYHAQLGPAYAHFGIPRPVLLPRPSLTLVEPSQARVLQAEGLSLPELQADPEGRVAQWAREAHPQIEAAFASALLAVHREMANVEEVLGALDPTLRAAADAARGRAAHQIEALREKATRALKKRDQARADRLRRTRDTLMPGGLLQERGLGLVGLVARHGEALLDEIERRGDPWCTGHQVLELGRGGGA